VACQLLLHKNCMASSPIACPKCTSSRTSTSTSNGDTVPSLKSSHARRRERQKARSHGGGRAADEGEAHRRPSSAHERPLIRAVCRLAVCSFASVASCIALSVRHHGSRQQYFEYSCFGLHSFGFGDEYYNLSVPTCMVEASPATLGPDGRQDGRRPIAAMDGAPPNRTEQSRAERKEDRSTKKRTRRGRPRRRQQHGVVVVSSGVCARRRHGTPNSNKSHPCMDHGCRLAVWLKPLRITELHGFVPRDQS